MKTICDKCGAPIIEEDGKYLCSVCGMEYGDADRERRERTAEDVRYAEFYQDVSLERFRQIAERLAGAVGNTTYPEIAVQSDGSYCVQKATDNSQYAARNWLDVERFYQPLFDCSRQGLVGITADGRLEPTMIEMEKFFRELQEQGVSDMRMKDILVAEYGYTTTSMRYPYEEIHYEGKFLGLDMRGKVVIFNPFGVLGLNREWENDVKECGRVMRELRSWPPIARLRRMGVVQPILCGVTENGKVVCTNHKERMTVQKWENVEDVIELEYGSPNCWVALKKDGTLLSDVSRESADEEVKARARLRKGWQVFLDAINELSGVVQIKARKISGGAALLYLTQSGELYQQDFKYGPEQIPPKLLAKNVVSLYGEDSGYISADGHRYNGEGKQLSTVPLFGDILTLESKWREVEERRMKQKYQDQIRYILTLTAAEAARRKLPELKTQRAPLEDALEEKRQRLREMEAERGKLGFFKRKEKQRLDESIEELRANMETETEKQVLSELNDKIAACNRAIADCKMANRCPAVWKAGLRYEEPTWNPGGVDAAALAAQVRSSISGPPKKDKSVIGNAAVGGLVAGPTGAVVGAIYAADKNRRKKK